MKKSMTTLYNKGARSFIVKAGQVRGAGIIQRGDTEKSLLIPPGIFFEATPDVAKNLLEKYPSEVIASPNKKAA